MTAKANTGTVDISELLSLIKRYDDWELWSEVESLAHDHDDDEGYAGRLLWSARKAGKLTMADANHMLYLMHGAPDLWDANDLLALIHEVQTHFPDGACDRGWTGWCGELPGSADGLHEMIKEKQGDKAFSAAMSQRWTELPMYWRIGVGFYLVCYGHMPHTDYPQEMKEQVALAYLTSSDCEYDDETYTQAFPQKTWDALLHDVLLSDRDFGLYTPKVLEKWLPLFTPEEMLQVTMRCKDTHGIQEAIIALDALGDKGHLLLESHLQSIELRPYDPSDNDKPWPYALLMFAYLRHCQRAQQVPVPALDELFHRMFEPYEMQWSGSGAAEYQAMMVELLAVIPSERLESLLLGLTKFPWLWIASCPTPKVLQIIVDKIAALPKSDDYRQEQLIQNLSGDGYTDYPNGLLAPIREALVPYIVTTLQKTKKAIPHREVLAKLLAPCESDAALDGLRLLLEDTSKAVQDAAKGGFIKQGAEKSLPHLAKILQAKRKSSRMAAARLLGQFRADQQLYDLAQKHLATETTIEVLALLNKVKAPSLEPDPVLEYPEAFASLVEHKGSNWAAHLSLGPVLVDLFWSAWSHVQYKDGSGDEINTHNDFYDPWIELLSQFKGKESALSTAIKIMPCFTDIYLDDYLDALEPLFPTLHKHLIPFVEEGEFELPFEAGGGIKEDDSMDNLLSWMEGKDFSLYGRAMLAGLKEKRKASRRVPMQELAAAGSDALPLLREALADELPHVRKSAIELLQRLRSKEALSALEEAQQKEPQQAIKKQLDAAISALKKMPL